MKSTYTRDFGTYIGRFRPRSNGISGSVSIGWTNLFLYVQKWGLYNECFSKHYLYEIMIIKIMSVELDGDNYFKIIDHT